MFYSKFSSVVKRKYIRKILIWCLLKLTIFKNLEKNTLSLLIRKFRLWIRVWKFDKRKELFLIKLSKYIKLSTKRNYFMFFKLFLMIDTVKLHTNNSICRMVLRQIKNYSMFQLVSFNLGNYLAMAENDSVSQTISLTLFRVYYFKIIKKMIILLRRSVFNYVCLRMKEI